MAYEEDFVDESLVELKISRKGFMYKPTTTKDQQGWLSEIVYVDEKGKIKDHFEKRNRCKAMNLKAVPYDHGTIHRLIGAKQEWKDLNDDQKWALLGKLKPGLFDDIMAAMNKIDKADDAQKKS